MGVMSGTLDLVQRAYLGTEIRDDVLRFDPRLADRLDGLSLPMQFRRTAIRVTLAQGELTVAALADGPQNRFASAIAMTSASCAAGSGARSGRRGGERLMSFAGAIFDVDGVLVDSPHERLARHAARADGGRLARRPAADELCPEGFTHRPLPAEEVAAADVRRPSCAPALRLPGRRGDGRGLRRPQAAPDRRADRGGRVHRLPGCAAHGPGGPGAGIAIATASSSKNAALFLRAIRRRVRRRAGPRPRLRAPRLKALLDFVDAEISGRTSPGASRIRDLPGRRRRARPRPARVLWSRTRRPGITSPWPAGWRRSAARGDDEALLRRPARTP